MTTTSGGLDSTLEPLPALTEAEALAHHLAIRKLQDDGAWYGRMVNKSPVTGALNKSTEITKALEYTVSTEEREGILALTLARNGQLTLEEREVLLAQMGEGAEPFKTEIRTKLALFRERALEIQDQLAEEGPIRETVGEYQLGRLQEWSRGIGRDAETLGRFTLPAEEKGLYVVRLLKDRKGEESLEVVRKIKPLAAGVDFSIVREGYPGLLVRQATLNAGQACVIRTDLDATTEHIRSKEWLKNFGVQSPSGHINLSVNFDAYMYSGDYRGEFRSMFVIKKTTPDNPYSDVHISW